MSCLQAVTEAGKHGNVAYFLLLGRFLNCEYIQQEVACDPLFPFTASKYYDDTKSTFFLLVNKTPPRVEGQQKNLFHSTFLFHAATEREESFGKRIFPIIFPVG